LTPYEKIATYRVANLQGENMGLKVAGTATGSLLGGFVGEQGSKLVLSGMFTGAAKFNSEKIFVNGYPVYREMQRTAPSVVQEGIGLLFEKKWTVKSDG
jgi:uncharacterized protein YcfJ